MTISLKDNRWLIQDGDFAAQVIVPDLVGCFEGLVPKPRNLVIEPGTRALVIDEGLVVGEVPAGQYTMESFFERLKFWRNKQTTIFLTRAEDIAVESVIKDAPCADSIFISAAYRWTVQMNDVLSFMSNLMGAQDSISISQLEQLLHPIMGQAVRDAIGTMSYDAIRAPDFTRTLVSGVHVRVDAKLKRYGLLFHDIQSFTISEEDALARQQGALQIQSREVQLQRAVGNVDNDRLRARLEEYQNKIPVRSALREIVAGDKVNQLQSTEDFMRAIAQIDKQRLLRQEEVDKLVEAFEERKEDRQQLRSHMLAAIDLQREQELESLRLDLDHAVRLKSLGLEIELARLSRAGDAESWRAGLEREREASEHRWNQKRENLKARWERIREVRRQRRDESWEDLVHQQKLQEIAGDLEFARAESIRKVAILESELRNRLEAEKLEIQKRQQEWELDVQQKKSLSQIERLQKVQEMNARFAEQQQRMQVELENLKADSVHKRELDRIHALSGLSTEALVATASTDNAALLADLKKHEATQATARVQATSNPSAEMDQERQRLYERMNETERAKAEAIAEAYRAAMQAQQTTVQQMIGGLAQVAKPPGSPSGMPGQASSSDTWHVSLNGQHIALQGAQVYQYIQNGQITSTTMVWRAGMTDWMAAGQVPELAPNVPPGPPPGPASR